jgi:hypothetical protein
LVWFSCLWHFFRRASVTRNATAQSLAGFELRFEFQKCSELLIGTHNKTLSVDAMRVHNPDRPPFANRQTPGPACFVARCYCAVSACSTGRDFFAFRRASRMATAAPTLARIAFCERLRIIFFENAARYLNNASEWENGAQPGQDVQIVRAPTIRANACDARRFALSMC